MSEPINSQSKSLFDDPLDDGTFDGLLPEAQAELRALKLSLLRGSQSHEFQLIFARCNVEPYQQVLIRRLQAELPDLKIQHIHFDEKIDHLLDQLRWRLEEPMPDAVFVTGLEHSYMVRTERPRQSPLILNLNASRNSFARYLPRPLVIWLPEAMLTALFHGAPDFFAVRSGVYSFIAAVETTVDVAEELTSDSYLQIRNLTESEKQRRIATICSLLADYDEQSESKHDIPVKLALLLQLSLLQMVLNQANESRLSSEQAIQLARQIGDRRRESTALCNLGVAYAELGEVRKAIEFHEQALVIDRETGNLHGVSTNLGSLGNDYYFLGERHKAIEFYEQALAIDREVGNRQGEGFDLGNLGNAYASLGKVRRAIKFHKGHLVIAREIGDGRGEATALGNLGSAYRDSGNLRKSINFLEQQLGIVRGIGDHHGESAALINLGNNYWDLGEKQKSIECHEQALIICRKAGNRRGEGIALGNLGWTYFSLGDPQKSIGFYEQALSIAQEVEDHLHENRWLSHVAMASRRLGEEKWAVGETAQALECFERALTAHRDLGDAAGEAIDLGLIGGVNLAAGEAKLAMEYYDLAAAAARRGGDQKLEAELRWKLSRAWDAISDRRHAIASAEEALKLADTHDQETAAAIRGQLAEWRNGATS